MQVVGYIHRYLMQPVTSHNLENSMVLHCTAQLCSKSGPSKNSPLEDRAYDRQSDGSYCFNQDTDTVFREDPTIRQSMTLFISILVSCFTRCFIHCYISQSLYSLLYQVVSLVYCFIRQLLVSLVSAGALSPEPSRVGGSSSQYTLLIQALSIGLGESSTTPVYTSPDHTSAKSLHLSTPPPFIPPLRSYATTYNIINRSLTSC